MIVLTGVNFTDNENIYIETKHSLIKCMCDLAGGKARTGLDIHLEPAWRKSIGSSNRTEHVQCSNSGWAKKKLNSLVSGGKYFIVHSCGSYRHLMAECQDSWET